MNELVKQVNNFILDYETNFNIVLDLVFFQDALEHLTRICRILRSERGNAMLIGVGGCGK